MMFPFLSSRIITAQNTPFGYCQPIILPLKSWGQIKAQENRLKQSAHSQDANRSDNPSKSTYYEIRVEGELDRNWSEWFDGLDVTSQKNGETLIAGPVTDQAALQGILTKVFNLRLPLISVSRIQPGASQC